MMNYFNKYIFLTTTLIDLFINKRLGEALILQFIIQNGLVLFPHRGKSFVANIGATC